VSPGESRARVCGWVPSAGQVSLSVSVGWGDTTFHATAAKTLVERGVVPLLGNPARLLVPAHDVAADRRQRRPWRGAARAAVSDSTAAFFASTAAGATFLDGAGGDHVHGGARGLAGVPLWVSERDWRQSPARRPQQHVGRARARSTCAAAVSGTCCHARLHYLATCSFLGFPA